MVKLNKVKLKWLKIRKLVVNILSLKEYFPTESTLFLFIYRHFFLVQLTFLVLREYLSYISERYKRLFLWYK